MSFISALYTLIISPLVIFLETIYVTANRIIGNAGISIIFLSLAVNFLILPLYKKADELQSEERDIQNKMAPMVKHIKKTFRGNERFLMLQEYYRINNYKPIYALKSSLSLLLQIPFFIAAYNLLSGMQSLQGMQFGFISDLGKEDALFMIGNFPINVLPIVMTAINVFSGIVYSKGHPLKAKVQIYGLAALFLVLLYHSPSGLVFYWLLNNVFSLLKNLFYKFKNPKLLFKITIAVLGCVTLIYSLMRFDLNTRQKVLLVILGLVLCIPLILSFTKIKMNRKKPATSNDAIAFFAGAIFMAFFTGLLIPSSIVDLSPLEFLDSMIPLNPLVYIANSMLLALGSWVLWGGVFYSLASDSIKVLFNRAIWVIDGISVVDYLFFGTKLGNLSSTLQYDISPSFRLSEYALNILAIVLTIIVLDLLYVKKPKIQKTIIIISSLSVFLIGAYHCIGILGSYNANNYFYKPSEEMPRIQLSKTGKNVVVIMLDRALGTQVPYIFNEKPELKNKFDGFTYYPNTISFGTSTNVGAPALYGGYEYTPERMNARPSEKLVNKHNEALKVMPVIFADNGFTVTVCDPSYAGYKWIPDLSIFNDYPDFHCYNMHGKFSVFDNDKDGQSLKEISIRIHKIRNRNLYCFSLMKAAPLIMQETIYDGGLYNESYIGPENEENEYYSSVVQVLDGLSSGYGYDLDFIWAYSVLNELPNITEIDETSNNSFVMMCSDITHSDCLLQKPDYKPSLLIDNTAYDEDMRSYYTIDGKTMNMSEQTQVTHYCVNMAAYIKLGEWFDYLRAQGVYDNTRIILVADHGKDLGQFNISCNDGDMESFMPLLMVKDFNAKGFSTCRDFMTNGDTPVLAMDGIITNPVNPFTGNPINSELKKGPQLTMSCTTDDWKTEINNGNTFLPGSWYLFRGGDPHDPDNWTYQGFF